jgi:predicted dehydrogenase
MTLDVGFLGYGFMGKAHANALARLPMFFPDAPATNRDVLIGRNEAAVSEAAERFGFDRIATDWRDVVDEIDIFCNLGPNQIHAEPTIAALEADVHVLCEKPLAPDIETASEMRGAARDSDATDAISFNYRYLPAVQLIKRLVEEGELGEIYRFKGRYLQDWLADPEAPWNWRCDEGAAGSGVVGDVGAHTVDLARWIVGDIEQVTGSLTTQITERPAPDGDGTREVTIDDEYSALIRFENGTEGVLEGSRIATGRKADNSIEIYGSKGAVEFSLRRLNELKFKGADDREYQQLLVTEPDDPYMEAWWPAGHIIGWEHAMVHQYYEFLTSIAAGDRHRPDFEDGVAVQHVVDSIQASSENGEWVSVRR